MRGILLYTLARVGLFLVVFIPLQFTPLRGLLAAAIAILVSLPLSMLLLNRQRDSASRGIYGVFSRINQRIEASRTAEDYDDDTPPSDSPTASSTP